MHPEHVNQNREAWTRMSVDYVEPGRRAWARGVIDWGIWNVPESTIHALGDLEELQGKDVIELGCGTAYFSSWLARLGSRAVGIDITPAQLEAARGFQAEFGIEFPLIEGNAEKVPLPDGSFDLALSEYGASIWCDPFAWIPEASRLLRSGGRLVFLRNSTLLMLCSPDADDGIPGSELQRSLFGMNRLCWEGAVEFQLPHGKLIDLLHSNGFQVKRLIEVEPPEDATETRWEHVSLEWSRRWPSEEIWVAHKR